MNRTLLAAAALLAALAPLPAVAGNETPQGVTQLIAAPDALKADKAYLLLSSSQAKSGLFKITHVLMRIPSEAEVSAFRAAKEASYQENLPKLRKAAGDKGTVPSLEDYAFGWGGAENVFAIDLGQSLGVGSDYLIEVPPGTYVLYGVTTGTRWLASCNCLGTVKFEAKPGIITRMGGLFADKVHKASPVPHLEDNLGEQMFQYGFVLGQALVPATATTPIPAGLERLPNELAAYRPVGFFREPGAASVNRLAPIPGVLEYDRGRVVLPAK